MKDVEWIPEDVDVTRPSPARVYDYVLGGSHNFQADREAAARFLAVSPQDWRRAVWVNRRFLRRAVRLCLDAGVTQFLDLGSGLPTVANVHETAHDLNPGARIVYVDVDPVAYKHCRVLLRDNPNAGAVHADLRDVDGVLNDSVTTELIDFTKPVALIMAAVVHFLPDSDDPGGIIHRYANRLSPGSYLTLTHFNDEAPQWRDGFELYRRDVADWTSRTRAEIETFFAGLELFEPGVAWIEDWPHDPHEIYLHDPPTQFAYAGIGRKP